MACACTCSLSQDPQLTYILGPGTYKQVDCTGLGLREIPSDFPLDTQVVILSKNNIVTLVTDNLDELRGLLYLDLSHNYIPSIPRDAFRFHTNLKYLDVGWNKVRIVHATALVPLQKLTRLLLSSNVLTAVPTAIQNLPALYLLDLSKNRILTVDRTAFVNLPWLQFLNLESNMISSIDANVLRRLTQLISLLLTGNQISYLPTYLFHGLQNLDHIALGENLLVNLPGIIFRGAPRLRKIDLHENLLTYLDPQLFRGMQILEEIYLNKNKLQNVPPGIFQGLRALSILDLSGNAQIRTLPVGIFRGLNALEELYVSHLQQIPDGLFWGMSILESLTITESNIEPVLMLIFRDITRLQVLNLSSNSITTIPDNLFQRMTILEELDLSSNQLASFSMVWFGNQMMISMVALSLQNNQIEELPAEAFVNTPSLVDLNLEGNKLSEIQDGIFDSRTRLDTLLLSNNELTFVSEGIIPKLANVEKLTVTNNRLTCDCHLRGFAEWMKVHIDAVVQPNEIICAVPRLYKNRQIVQLIRSPQNPFTCIFPAIVTRPRYKTVTMPSGASKEMFCLLSESAVADIIWTLPDGTWSKAPAQDMQPASSRPRVYTKASGSLVVGSISTKDAGVYKCTSQNTVGSDEITYDIRVLPPIVPPTTKKPATTTNPTGVPNNVPTQTTSQPKPVTVKVTAPPPRTVPRTEPRPGGRVTVSPGRGGAAGGRFTVAPGRGGAAGGRVTVAPGRGGAAGGSVTGKTGTSVNRTTLMTFTRAATTLPLSLCNPNPCKHSGQCQIVPKQSFSNSVEEESQESYSSSVLGRQADKTYSAPAADK